LGPHVQMTTQASIGECVRKRGTEGEEEKGEEGKKGTALLAEENCAEERRYKGKKRKKKKGEKKKGEKMGPACIAVHFCFPTDRKRMRPRKKERNRGGRRERKK